MTKNAMAVLAFLFVGMPARASEDFAVPGQGETVEEAGAGDAVSLPVPVETGIPLVPPDVFNGVPGVPEDAVAFYENLAARGNVHAQLNLAFLLASGKLVPQDLPAAAKWLERAAQQGNPQAQASLAVLLEKGLGVARNDALADKWQEKAAKQGHALAQYRLGQRAEASGADGCGAASSLYMQAARQGFAKAQLALGRLYRNGCGVRQDDLRAAEWFRKAAESGEAEAAHETGLFYKAKGDEARNLSGRNLVAARMWFLVAEGLWGQAPESSRARAMAADIAARMTGRERAQSERQAEEWLQRWSVSRPR